MILKVNSSNQLYALRKLLKGGILTFVVLPFFKFQLAIIIIGILLYLFFSLPVIYLHLVYYLINRGREITITENVLTVKVGKEITTVKKSDINNIVYCGLNDNLGTSVWSPMHMSIVPYQYIRIVTNYGKSTIITSLMYKNFNDVINEFRGITIRKTNNPFFILRKNMLSPLMNYVE